MTLPCGEGTPPVSSGFGIRLRVCGAKRHNSAGLYHNHIFSCTWNPRASEVLEKSSSYSSWFFNFTKPRCSARYISSAKVIQPYPQLFGWLRADVPRSGGLDAPEKATTIVSSTVESIGGFEWALAADQTFWILRMGSALLLPGMDGGVGRGRLRSGTAVATYDVCVHIFVRSIIHHCKLH